MIVSRVWVLMVSRVLFDIAASFFVALFFVAFAYGCFCSAGASRNAPPARDELSCVGLDDVAQAVVSAQDARRTRRPLDCPGGCRGSHQLVSRSDSAISAARGDRCRSDRAARGETAHARRACQSPPRPRDAGATAA